MKKTSIFLALALAAVSAFFVSCSTEGSTPEVWGAFFASEKNDDYTYNETKTAYEITTLDLDDTTNYFVIGMGDADFDIKYVNISTHENFSPCYRWEFNGTISDDEYFWMPLNLGWNGITKSEWTQATGTVYVMAEDLEGHCSDVYEIQGITFTY